MPDDTELTEAPTGAVSWQPGTFGRSGFTGTIAIPGASGCSYPIRAGNYVRPLVDGEATFRRICEAIETARSSVWATITFMWPAFRMPDGCGTALDVLDRAAARGLDVRLLFWRPDAETEQWKRNAFWGSEEQIEQLRTRRSGVRIRWDRAHPGYCQHQKSWLIDAGSASEVAFVGGLNLNPHSLVTSEHFGEGQNHEVSVELTGPATADVHHNFAQRWNEASERSGPDGRWGEGSEIDLSFPTRVPMPRGDAIVQIQRTVHAGRYTDGRPAPGGLAFDIASGEQSIYAQYCIAIRAAERTVYLENQYVTVPEIVTCLRKALERGVEVVVLVPAEMEAFPANHAQSAPRFSERWAALGAHERFTLAGIAGLRADGTRTPVHVHSKIMLIDDGWATVGSGNLHRYSLFGNGEMNVAFWSRRDVRALRSELFREHLGQDTSGLDDRVALQTFRRVAKENRQRLDRGRADWQGLAFAMDPSRYGA